MTLAAQAVLGQLLPEVVHTTTVVVSGFSDEELHAFLATLTKFHDAIAVVPDDLGPSVPRRTPRNLKRSRKERQ